VAPEAAGAEAVLPEPCLQALTPAAINKPKVSLVKIEAVFIISLIV